MNLLKHAFIGALCVVNTGCTATGQDPVTGGLPAGFVVVNGALRDVSFDIRYYGSDNFVGKPVDGYLAPLCILHRDVAAALGKAAHAATMEGYRLKIFDCYRPQRAVDHFVRWAGDPSDQSTRADYYPRLEKRSLLGPYIAARSSHSRGAALDLTLERRLDDQRWQALDMGTTFDFFDSLSNTFNESTGDEVLQNRKLLIRFMSAGGFVNYEKEWWHFSYPGQPYPDTYFDFPVAYQATP